MGNGVSLIPCREVIPFAKFDGSILNDLIRTVKHDIGSFKLTKWRLVGLFGSEYLVEVNNLHATCALIICNINIDTYDKLDRCLRLFDWEDAGHLNDSDVILAIECCVRAVSYLTKGQRKPRDDDVDKWSSLLAPPNSTAVPILKLLEALQGLSVIWNFLDMTQFKISLANCSQDIHQYPGGAKNGPSSNIYVNEVDGNLQLSQRALNNTGNGMDISHGALNAGPSIIKANSDLSPLDKFELKQAIPSALLAKQNVLSDSNTPLKNSRIASPSSNFSLFEHGNPSIHNSPNRTTNLLNIDSSGTNKALLHSFLWPSQDSKIHAAILALKKHQLQSNASFEDFLILARSFIDSLLHIKLSAQLHGEKLLLNISGGTKRGLKDPILSAWSRLSGFNVCFSRAVAVSKLVGALGPSSNASYPGAHRQVGSNNQRRNNARTGTTPYSNEQEGAKSLLHSLLMDDPHLPPVVASTLPLFVEVRRALIQSRAQFSVAEQLKMNHRPMAYALSVLNHSSSFLSQIIDANNANDVNSNNSNNIFHTENGNLLKTDTNNKNSSNNNISSNKNNNNNAVIEEEANMEPEKAFMTIDVLWKLRSMAQMERLAILKRLLFLKSEMFPTIKSLKRDMARFGFAVEFAHVFGSKVGDEIPGGDRLAAFGNIFYTSKKTLEARLTSLESSSVCREARRLKDVLARAQAHMSTLNRIFRMLRTRLIELKMKERASGVSPQELSEERLSRMIHEICVLLLVESRSRISKFAALQVDVSIVKEIYDHAKTRLRASEGVWLLLKASRDATNPFQSCLQLEAVSSRSSISAAERPIAVDKGLEVDHEVIKTLGVDPDAVAAAHIFISDEDVEHLFTSLPSSLLGKSGIKLSNNLNPNNINGLNASSLNISSAAANNNLASVVYKVENCEDSISVSLPAFQGSTSCIPSAAAILQSLPISSKSLFKRKAVWEALIAFLHEMKGEVHRAQHASKASSTISNETPNQNPASINNLKDTTAPLNDIDFERNSTLPAWAFPAELFSPKRSRLSSKMLSRARKDDKETQEAQVSLQKLTSLKNISYTNNSQTHNNNIFENDAPPSIVTKANTPPSIKIPTHDDGTSLMGASTVTNMDDVLHDVDKIIEEMQATSSIELQPSAESVLAELSQRCLSFLHSSPYLPTPPSIKLLDDDHNLKIFFGESDEHSYEDVNSAVSEFPATSSPNQNSFESKPIDTKTPKVDLIKKATLTVMNSQMCEVRESRARNIMLSYAEMSLRALAHEAEANPTGLGGAISIAPNNKRHSNVVTGFADDEFTHNNSTKAGDQDAVTEFRNINKHSSTNGISAPPLLCMQVLLSQKAARNGGILNQREGSFIPRLKQRIKREALFKRVLAHLNELADPFRRQVSATHERTFLRTLSDVIRFAERVLTQIYLEIGGVGQSCCYLSSSRVGPVSLSSIYPSFKSQGPSSSSSSLSDSIDDDNNLNDNSERLRGTAQTSKAGFALNFPDDLTTFQDDARRIFNAPLIKTQLTSASLPPISLADRVALSASSRDYFTEFKPSECIWARMETSSSTHHGAYKRLNRASALSDQLKNSLGFEVQSQFEMVAHPSLDECLVEEAKISPPVASCSANLHWPESLNPTHKSSAVSCAAAVIFASSVVRSAACPTRTNESLGEHYEALFKILSRRAIVLSKCASNKAQIGRLANEVLVSLSDNDGNRNNGLVKQGPNWNDIIHHVDSSKQAAALKSQEKAKGRINAIKSSSANFTVSTVSDTNFTSIQPSATSNMHVGRMIQQDLPMSKNISTEVDNLNTNSNLNSRRNNNTNNSNSIKDGLGFAPIILPPIDILYEGLDHEDETYSGFSSLQGSKGLLDDLDNVLQQQKEQNIHAIQSLRGGSSAYEAGTIGASVAPTSNIGLHDENVSVVSDEESKFSKKINKGARSIVRSSVDVMRVRKAINKVMELIQMLVVTVYPDCLLHLHSEFCGDSTVSQSAPGGVLQRAAQAFMTANNRAMTGYSGPSQNLNTNHSTNSLIQNDESSDIFNIHACSNINNPSGSNSKDPSSKTNQDVTISNRAKLATEYQIISDLDSSHLSLNNNSNNNINQFKNLSTSNPERPFTPESHPDKSSKRNTGGQHRNVTKLAVPDDDLVSSNNIAQSEGPKQFSSRGFLLTNKIPEVSKLSPATKSGKHELEILFRSVDLHDIINRKHDHVESDLDDFDRVLLSTCSFNPYVNSNVSNSTVIPLSSTHAIHATSNTHTIPSSVSGRASAVTPLSVRFNSDSVGDVAIRTIASIFELERAFGGIEAVEESDFVVAQDINNPKLKLLRHTLIMWVVGRAKLSILSSLVRGSAGGASVADDGAAVLCGARAARAWIDTELERLERSRASMAISCVRLQAINTFRDFLKPVNEMEALSIRSSDSHSKIQEIERLVVMKARQVLKTGDDVFKFIQAGMHAENDFSKLGTREAIEFSKKFFTQQSHTTQDPRHASIQASARYLMGCPPIYELMSIGRGSHGLMSDYEITKARQPDAHEDAVVMSLTAAVATQKALGAVRDGIILLEGSSPANGVN